jgi:2-dehydropantoate 2-reductase
MASPRSNHTECDERENDKHIIHNLIVATKATNTVPALLAVKGRLSRESTILFTQNGMGVVEEANSKMFPDIRSRPNYMYAIISHGVFSNGPFSSTHAGFGSTMIGFIPRQPPQDVRELEETHYAEDWELQPRYLLEAIMRAPVLAAAEVSPVGLMQIQLEKLVANVIINPLTAIFNCRNGELFKDAATRRLIQLILSETSSVLRSLPEIQGIEHAKSLFLPERLEAIVETVTNKTAKNTSSMLQDVRANRLTEIDYISGYIVKKGQEMGIDTMLNGKLLQMVKEKRQISKEQIHEFFPYDLEK